jgi:transglutaminase-like putative cysteine protease
VPRTGGRQTVESASLEVVPSAPVAAHRDAFGNEVRWFQIPDGHDSLVVQAEAQVVVEGPRTPAPCPVPDQEWAALGGLDYVDALADYLLPSTLVRWPGEVVALGESLDLPEDAGVGGWLSALEAAVHGAVTYTPGATGVDTPVESVARERRGVCQDMAHLTIALCRRRGVAARYVSGWLYNPGRDEPGQSHAWIEAHVPSVGWVEADPTHAGPMDDRYIRLAVGRDYADVAPIRGTYVGAPTEAMDVAVHFEELPI